MKKLRKKIIAILLISSMITLFKANTSNAVVESRPDSASLVNKTASEFFALIRKMETADGPMGLNATVDDQGNETTPSNNIDAHMIKNTEYGTVGMLAASIYGANTSGGYSYGSYRNTTGNATGVYQMGAIEEDNFEYVAGIYGESTSSRLTNIKNAPQKYWDNYTEAKLPKPGDGTLEISWGSTRWISSYVPVFNRNIIDYRTSGVFHYSTSDGSGSYNYSSRAVVVSGVGL